MECAASIDPTLVATLQQRIQASAPEAAPRAVRILLRAALTHALPAAFVPDGQYPIDLRELNAEWSQVTFTLVSVPAADPYVWPSDVSELFER